MNIRQRGFTLIELMVVLALVAILASMAAPSFRTLLAKRTVEAAAGAMLADLRFTRSESVKRAARVTLCQSSDGASCVGNAGAWTDGWIVFIDEDGDSALDAGDEVIRVQQRLPSMGSIASTNPASDRKNLTYQPTGWSRSANRTFIFKPAGSVAGSTQRILCISNQGRPGLKALGATSCAA